MAKLHENPDRMPGRSSYSQQYAHGQHLGPKPGLRLPQTRMKAFYHDHFAAPIGDHHIMPMRKFAAVRDCIADLQGIEVACPRPASPKELLEVHTPTYLEAVRTGTPRRLAESQKFPWSDRLYSSVCLTNGAVINASEAAIRDQVAAAIASGFHHAHADHGEGFCTFNGLVVAAESLRARGLVRNVAILDLDLHYGNGTAMLAEPRPWLRVLSLYGNDYNANTPYADVTVRHHEDGRNHRSVPLPEGCDGPKLLSILSQELPWLMSCSTPDLLLYQAGADMFRDDPYSTLDLSTEDLEVRDTHVFDWAKSHGIPTAWVLAGGYTEDLSKVVQIHTNTFLAAKSVYGF